MQKYVGQTSGSQPRINVWRLGKNMLLALVLPCTIAIVVDRLVGTWPILTLLVAGFAFPIAAFVVTRSALRELERVIQEIAPAEPEYQGVEDGETEKGA